jgi:adenylosuccinate lyase
LIKMSEVLRERYATREMVAIFSPERRYRTWRELWVVLAKSQRELGLPITEEQIWGLEEAAPRIDLERVAELERETRHDVVAHLRHFAEQATAGGGILHLGATSAYITDNTDVLLQRDALSLLRRRMLALAAELRELALRTAALPTLAYTHFQPAQLTTVGKRACLWLQDVMEDVAAVDERLLRLRCRGVKGTTGTQASFLTLFDGDHGRVEELDRSVASALGFERSWAVTGQTYPRKQDSQVLAALAGIGESCHKLGTDLRLLQGTGELSEPFGDAQVGSSAMAYKRNPIRAERMCGLARRLLTDALNGPLNAATQWLERSLDDSANRRLVIEDAFLTADAIVHLAAGIVRGLRVNESVIAARVARELPFMATETILMEAVVRGGDRQELHERLRRYSLEAQEAIAHGRDNPLIDRVASDGDFRLSGADLTTLLDARAFTGRSAEQVEKFLATEVDPVLDRAGEVRAAVEEPRV